MASASRQPEIVTKRSPRSVTATVASLLELLADRGLTVFAVIDQAEAARTVGLALRETTLVLFGSPAAGTPVMAEAPLAALDLPLKVLVWADDGGANVTYLSPEAIGSRYDLDQTLVDRLAGVHALTDAVTAAETQ